MRLRPARPLCLIRLSWCVLPVVVAALATAVPSRAEELTLRAPVPSRTLLDSQQREISVVLDGRMRGSWPVAIGDPKTPTPQGGAILAKEVNPIYFSNKLGQHKELSGPAALSEIAIWLSIAMVAVNSVSMALPGPTG